MKKLNEGLFFHAKSRTYDNEFHAPSFPCRTRKYRPYCSPPPFKDNLPFH